ncbi:MAG: hypothetical protein CFE37_12285 [Alphaproteobacteria bacterium PA4]|nr:MAG: hypothetical protein CFE37_12285 [Alphaproteobacteria bacterium PA4]
MSPLPALPIVTAVAGALLVSACDSPVPAGSTRLCQDSNGRRAPEAKCRNGSSGHGYIFARNSAVPAIGERVSGTARTGDVSRGGFGMSAHASSGE